MLPSKIISGAQTGADRAALEFAVERGLACGGWCPRGGRTDEGKLTESDFQRFQLRETEAWGYQDRTRLNVHDADATIIFNRGTLLSPGCALTMKACREYNRPFKVLRLPDAWFLGLLEQTNVDALGRDVARFLASSRPATLNVAGNRERSSPGIGAIVQAVLGSAWSQVETVGIPLPESRAGQEQFTLLLDDGAKSGKACRAR